MRTFIALELPAENKEQLHRLIKRLQEHNLRTINWVAPQNLHITLLFIGEIELQQQSVITSLIEELVNSCPAPVFSAPQIMLIPSQKPHLLWVEYKCISPEIAVVYRQLIKQLTESGYRLDKKPLRFHVTLGRIKGYISPPFISEVLNQKIPPLAFKSSILTFYKSILQPQGPEYFPLVNFYLK
ncbi:MAG: RNA 2',3'-cyclic phosphodiesterase [Candidatus Cloacimonetes bacterium]|nr:RNA 2',3'-cyclic phosphodiesterase [Candidatus Cloacimonadota bacterium]